MPYNRQPKEPFTKTERRDWAETVLDNPELLMMYAQSSGAVSSIYPIPLLQFTLVYESQTGLCLITETMTANHPSRPYPRRGSGSRRSCAAWTTKRTTTMTTTSRSRTSAAPGRASSSRGSTASSPSACRPPSSNSNSVAGATAARGAGGGRVGRPVNWHVLRQDGRGCPGRLYSSHELRTYDHIFKGPIGAHELTRLLV